MKIDKEKALKIIYELIIFSEERDKTENFDDRWRAYDYIKEKLEIKPQANERNRRV